MLKIRIEPTIKSQEQKAREQIKKLMRKQPPADFPNQQQAYQRYTCFECETVHVWVAPGDPPYCDNCKEERQLRDAEWKAQRELDILERQLKVQQMQQKIERRKKVH